MKKANHFYLLKRSFTCPNCKKPTFQIIGASMVKANPALIAETAKNVVTECGECRKPLPAGIGIIEEAVEISEDRYNPLKIPRRFYIEN